MDRREYLATAALTALPLASSGCVGTVGYQDQDQDQDQNQGQEQDAAAPVGLRMTTFSLTVENRGAADEQVTISGRVHNGSPRRVDGVTVTVTVFDRDDDLLEEHTDSPGSLEPDADWTYAFELEAVRDDIGRWAADLTHADSEKSE